MENKTAVLVIEESNEDREAIIEALGEASYQLHLLSDVLSAMAFLRRTKASAPFADLVLIEPQVPKGELLLSQIKQDPQLKLIPVIVLTRGQDPEAINRYYDHGANCCIRKPQDPKLFRSAVRDAVEFWSNLCHRVYREQDELVFVQTRYL